VIKWKVLHGGCSADVAPVNGQLYKKGAQILFTALSKSDLLLEIIAFCRELVKVAPPNLLPDCYACSGDALRGLQKLDEAEEILNEGLAVCREKGL
jgi:hypothetical protein